jgi:hypothetical protein
MTNQQILEQAIQKAIDGGFNDSATASWIRKLMTDTPEESRRFSPMLIFNHDFAKALWGEDLVCIFDESEVCNGTNEEGEEYWRCSETSSYGNSIHGEWGWADDDTDGVKKQWQYHLQQMVIAEDPIKYLGENL